MERGGVYGLGLAERGGVYGLGLAERGGVLLCGGDVTIVIRTRNSTGLDSKISNLTTTMQPQIQQSNY